MARYALLLVQILILSANAENSLVQGKFKEFKLDGDNAFGDCALPDTLLEVEYAERENVHLGNEMSLTDVSSYPSFIGFESCNDEKYYDLIMFDPDSLPTTTVKPGKPLLHWWLANIHNCNFEDVDIVAPYISPMPNPGPPHRYTLTLFEHDDKAIMSDYTKLYKTTAGRTNFSFQDICKKYSNPVAGNFYQAKSVDPGSIASGAYTTDGTVSGASAPVGIGSDDSTPKGSLL